MINKHKVTKIRLSIKIIMFPVGRVAKKGATGDFFFFHFCKKKKHSKNGQYFPTKKKIIAAAQLSSILATRWTGNRLFFNGQPKTH